MYAVLSDFLSTGAVLCSIMVITVKSPVISVLFLIGVFVNVAGYLVVLGAAYLGLVYLIVYVGAIAILFLFVIMMLNLRLVELVDTGSDYTKSLPMGTFLSALFVYEMLGMLPETHYGGSLYRSLGLVDSTNVPVLETASLAPVTADVHAAFSPTTFETVQVFSQIETIGFSLYTYGAI
jgi:NADH-ubiquinone oxidoreductase chain 6